MVKRLTSDDRNDKSRGFAPAERNVEGEPVGPSFEGVVGEGTLSRRRMLGLAGGALAGVLLAPLSLSGGEASANQDSPSTFEGTYTIRQQSTRRYLDAYNYHVAMYNGDYRVVTRYPFQNDGTESWLLDRFRSNTGTTFYRLRQKAYPGRYLDAYTTSNQLNAVMMRDYKNDDTQRWLRTLHDDIEHATLYFRFQNKSNGGYLDAYTSSPQTDYRVVTNTKYETATARQNWLLTKIM
jgi:hypothetical protein